MVQRQRTVKTVDHRLITTSCTMSCASGNLPHSLWSQSGAHADHEQVFGWPSSVSPGSPAASITRCRRSHPRFGISDEKDLSRRGGKCLSYRLVCTSSVIWIPSSRFHPFFTYFHSFSYQFISSLLVVHFHFQCTPRSDINQSTNQTLVQSRFRGIYEKIRSTNLAQHCTLKKFNEIQ